MDNENTKKTCRTCRIIIEQGKYCSHCVNICDDCHQLKTSVPPNDDTNFWHNRYCKECNTICSVCRKTMDSVNRNDGEPECKDCQSLCTKCQKFPKIVAKEGEYQPNKCKMCQNYQTIIDDLKDILAKIGEYYND